MRVALLAARMDTLGGVETVMLRTARYLQGSGREVCVVSTAFHPEVKRALDAAGIEARALGSPEESCRLRSLDRIGKAAREALADCDAVNVHNFPAQIWLVPGWDRLAIYSCHEPPRHLYESIMNPVFLRSRFNTRPWFTRAWDRLLGMRWRNLDVAATRRMRYILTNSRYTADKIKAIYGFSAIPAYFGPEPPAEPVERATGEGFRILFAGRLVPTKNLDTAIEAVARLPHEVGVTFRVVGEGDQRPRLEALVRRLEAPVVFLGGVSDAVLQQEYAAADVALYVPFDEPMGLIPMEAALRGVPAVVSDHGGPAEVVIHERTGLHADALDAASVSAALLRFAREPELRRRCGDAAEERVRNAMSFDVYAHTLDTMLNSSKWEAAGVS